MNQYYFELARTSNYRGPTVLLILCSTVIMVKITNACFFVGNGLYWVNHLPLEGVGRFVKCKDFFPH